MEIVILILILCCFINALSVGVLCVLTIAPQKSNKERVKLSEEDIRRRERERRELQNFWNYNGEEQSR